MPRAKRNAKQMMEDIDSAEGLSATRRTDVELAKQAKKKAKEKRSSIAKKNRLYTLAYVLIAIAVFGLGLLAIALMNLAIYGEFGL